MVICIEASVYNILLFSKAVSTVVSCLGAALGSLGAWSISDSLAQSPVIAFFLFIT